MDLIESLARYLALAGVFHGGVLPNKTCYQAVYGSLPSNSPDNAWTFLTETGWKLNEPRFQR